MQLNKTIIIILCLILGLVTGFFVTKSLSPRKSVYMIVDITVKNENLYSKYIAKVPKIIEKYGGRYLVRGGEITLITGNWNPQRIIIVEFDSMEQLRRCFSSQEYLELSPLREKSTVGKSIVVKGYE